MDVLNSLISELDGYTLGHIQLKLESDKSKAFQLFKMYKSAKGKEVDDEMIMKKLYGSSKEKGNLYRLKNRLVNNINQALLELNTAEGKTAFLSEQHLILYKVFQAKAMHQLAEYYLQKSIKYAEANEQYSLLDIIYGEMISFCKDSLKQDPEVYIQKRRANFKMFNTLRTMDEILAVMTYRLKSTQNLSGQLNVNKEIDKTLKNFASDKEIFKSNQFKIKFYKTVSQILIQQQKFPELEKFIRDTRNDFLTAGIFNKQTHDIKIEQLVYLTNALLVQRKFDAVIENSKLLYEAMQEYDRNLFNKYIYFYYQARINSYAVLDISKAIEVQQEVLGSEGIIKDPYFIVFNYANLAFLYFMQKNYKQVVKTLQKVYLNNFYPKVDISLKVELAVMELIARFELADVNTFEYRMSQVASDLDGAWSTYTGAEKILFEIIQKITENTGFKKDKGVLKLVNQYLKLNRENTGQVFNFEGWLREKFHGQIE
jgi:hypothetical protein